MLSVHVLRLRFCWVTRVSVTCLITNALKLVSETRHYIIN